MSIIKKLQILVCAGILIVVIGGRGNNSNDNQENPDLGNNTDIEETSLTYQEYEIQGITVELPEEWNISESDDGYVANFESDISAFTMWAFDGIQEKEFGYFGGTYYMEYMEETGTTSIECSENTYSNHDAYNYEGEVLIQGKQCKVKSTVLYSNECAIIMLLVYDGDDFDYADIYDTILNSIK